MPERRMLSILFSSKENGTAETLNHLGSVQNYIMKKIRNRWKKNSADICTHPVILGSVASGVTERHINHLAGEGRKPKQTQNQNPKLISC